MKRFRLLAILLIISVITLVLVANFQKDTNTISINDIDVIKASMIMIIMVFLPPIFLTFFESNRSRMLSFYYQFIFLFGFLILVPVGLFSFRGIPVTISALCGIVASLKSLSITKPEKK